MCIFTYLCYICPVAITYNYLYSVHYFVYTGSSVLKPRLLSVDGKTTGSTFPTAPSLHSAPVTYPSAPVNTSQRGAIPTFSAHSQATPPTTNNQSGTDKSQEDSTLQKISAPSTLPRDFFFVVDPSLAPEKAYDPSLPNHYAKVFEERQLYFERIEKACQMVRGIHYLLFADSKLIRKSMEFCFLLTCCFLSSHIPLVLYYLPFSTSQERDLQRQQAIFHSAQEQIDNLSRNITEPHHNLQENISSATFPSVNKPPNLPSISSHTHNTSLLTTSNALSSTTLLACDSTQAKLTLTQASSGEAAYLRRLQMSQQQKPVRLNSEPQHSHTSQYPIYTHSNTYPAQRERPQYVPRDNSADVLPYEVEHNTLDLDQESDLNGGYTLDHLSSETGPNPNSNTIQTKKPSRFHE